MEEQNDIGAKLDQLIQALTAVVQKVDEISARQDELDTVLYDGIIGPANDQIAQNEYDNALSDFRTKYAEKLGPFENAAKAIEGDDFDVFKASFDGYNEGGYDFSPDEYVDKVASSLSEQIAHIKEAVAEEKGVSPEDVDVKVDAEDGEVTVDVDDTTTEEKPEDNVTETTETDAPIVERKEEEVVEEGDGDGEEKEKADEEDELTTFKKSLEEEAEKDKGISWLRG